MNKGDFLSPREVLGFSPLCGEEAEERIDLWLSSRGIQIESPGIKKDQYFSHRKTSLTLNTPTDFDSLTELNLSPQKVYDGHGWAIHQASPDFDRSLVLGSVSSSSLLRRRKFESPHLKHAGSAEGKNELGDQDEDWLPFRGPMSLEVRTFKVEDLDL
jgi:hypothetical protein